MDERNFDRNGWRGSRNSAGRSLGKEKEFFIREALLSWMKGGPGC